MSMHVEKPIYISFSGIITENSNNSQIEIVQICLWTSALGDITLFVRKTQWAAI